MAQAVILKKISKNNIFIDNIFYGREVCFTFPCNREPSEGEVRRHETQFSVAIQLTIGRYPCSLLLEALPPLAVFSKQFDGIDLFSVPETIRLLVFQAATEVIQTHFSNMLKATISVDAIAVTTPIERQSGIDFLITLEKNYATAGTLVAPKAVLVLLAKRIQNTPNLHYFRNLEAPYHIRIGSTQLSKEDYQNLREEDIVFLDRYELAKSKKVDIVGLSGVEILVAFAEAGVTVERIVR
jgi:hypothetical protein